jgi:hypothetical protein
MSYARFGWGGSDVYVYLDSYGSLVCCGCALTEATAEWPLGRSPHVYSTDAMLAHLAEHQAAGHTVPESCIADLGRDRDENDAFIAARTMQSHSPDAPETDGA